MSFDLNLVGESEASYSDCKDLIIFLLLFRSATYFDKTLIGAEVKLTIFINIY